MCVGRSSRVFRWTTDRTGLDGFARISSVRIHLIRPIRSQITKSAAEVIAKNYARAAQEQSSAHNHGFEARRGRSRWSTLSCARGRPDKRHSIRLIATVAVSAVEALEVRTTGSSSLIVS
jgi:hypothetical protein